MVDNIIGHTLVDWSFNWTHYQSDYVLIRVCRNSAYTEFRMFFSIPYIPYIPYSIRNCPEFRGIQYYGIRRIPRNFAQFRDFLCHGIPHNFILLVSFIVKTVSWHFFSFKSPGSPQKFLDLTPRCQIDSPLHHAGVRFDSPLHHAAIRFDSLLHHAAVRFDSPL
jgi:hypothetical protein